MYKIQYMVQYREKMYSTLYIIYIVYIYSILYSIELIMFLGMTWVNLTADTPWSSQGWCDVQSYRRGQWIA